MFPLVLDSNDALPPGEMSSACAARLREAQIGFFNTHACWFNTSNAGRVGTFHSRHFAVKTAVDYTQ
jgi:hypothetical protein